MARYIDADELHKIIENGVGTPALKLFADCCVELAPTADVAPKAEVAREVIKEIEDAINKRYDQHVFSCDLEDTEAEAVMDFHTDLYFDIEKNQREIRYY
jgi:hypothetical protein